MISIRNISKIYRIYDRRTDRFREWLFFGRKKFHGDFWALRDICLEIPKGAAFGIIGMNGAGKSTLLKILTGTTKPSLGSFSLNGRVAALLELGTGFHPELTGRENVIMNGKLIGFSSEEINSKMGEIQDFCELGDFFDKPIRTYSSGMYVRLAFALASSIDADILIIDEALSVGDAYFQSKCLSRLRQFKEKGVTILFVSHDAGTIKMLCDEVAILNEGRLVSTGSAQDMLEMYNALLARKDGHGTEYIISKREQQVSGGEVLVSGNHKAEIVSISFQNDRGARIQALSVGERVKLVIDVKFNDAIGNPTVGIMIRDRLGYDIFGTNTAELSENTGSYSKGETARFVFDIHMNIGAGDFSVTAALHSSRTHIEECYQWVDRILTFKVLPHPEFHFLGVSFLRPGFSVEKV
ncbi:MAG: ABC transporter ATP-binding protein [Oligoflexales bacterium]|nr:ABC transporter ATP-binding protein [Oligoflexales bacterium]